MLGFQQIIDRAPKEPRDGLPILRKDELAGAAVR
jgi:hypothetical protein